MTVDDDPEDSAEPDQEPDPGSDLPDEVATSTAAAASLARARALQHQVELTSKALEPLRLSVKTALAQQLTEAWKPVLARSADHHRNALALASESIRWSDKITPSVLRSLQTQTTADVSRVLMSDSAFTGWRTALATQEMLRSIEAATIPARSLFTRQLLDDLEQRVRVNAKLARLLADASPSRAAIATRPLAAYERFLSDLERHPDWSRGPALARAAGFGVNGLVASDGLQATPDPEDAEELAATVEVDVVEPWQQAAIDTHSELYGVLGGIHPKIVEMLQGAWDSVARPGPAGAEKVANCAVEAIDRALRHGAPDDDIRAWIPGSGHRESDLVVNGKIKRSARVKFILRNRRGDRRLVQAQVEGLCASVEALNDRLQAAKHASEGDIATVRSHLVTAEAVLTQLFVVGD